MRKLLVFLALCGALPITILAQDNSANTPQPKPADTQDKSTPTLEKPGMAPASAGDRAGSCQENSACGDEG